MPRKRRPHPVSITGGVTIVPAVSIPAALPVAAVPIIPDFPAQERNRVAVYPRASRRPSPRTAASQAISWTQWQNEPTGSRAELDVTGREQEPGSIAAGKFCRKQKHPCPKEVRQGIPAPYFPQEALKPPAVSCGRGRRPPRSDLSRHRFPPRQPAPRPRSTQAAHLSRSRWLPPP